MIRTLLASLRILALGLPLVAGGTVPLAAAELHPAVTVSQDVVRLGDLFDDAGKAADVVIAQAPAPGLAGQLSVSRISLAARRSGIDWHNHAGLTHVVIARAGVQVPETDIAAAIADAVTARSPSLSDPSSLQVDFAQGLSGIQVADGAPLTVKVEQLAWNNRNGTFAAAIRAPADDALAPLRRVSGRAYPVRDVPVLSRDMMPGDVVKARDIQWVKLPASRVAGNIVGSENQLKGMSPRRPVRAGEPLRLSDMEPPVLVGKGAQVDVVYKTGALTLTARGRALEDGAIGDVVRIMNIRSNRTIEGTVSAPNTISIDASSPARASLGGGSATNG